MLNDLSQSLFIFYAVYPWAISDVLINGHRKRIRLLKDHADAPAELNHIHGARINVLAVEYHPAFQPGAGDEIVHSIEGPEERGLPASRWTDKRGHKTPPDGNVHIVERLLSTVEKIRPFNADLYLVVHCRIRFLMIIAVRFNRKVRTSSTNTVEYSRGFVASISGDCVAMA